MNNNTDREYEALLENYEDALMRLVMYQVAQEDGKRLLEEMEELENSGFEVPKELDEKCIKLMQSACAPKERKQVPAEAGTCKNESPHRLTLYTVGRVMVVAILAAVVLFCVAYAANDQFRVDVLNFFLELRENGTQFFFGPGGSGTVPPDLSGTSAIDGDFPFEFTYIPEGYELVQELAVNFGSSDKHYARAYADTNDEENNFRLDILPIDRGSSVLVDTEDAKAENIIIFGNDGMLIRKFDTLTQREQIQYIWFDMNNQLYYTFFSLGITQQESEKILNGIVVY